MEPKVSLVMLAAVIAVEVRRIVLYRRILGPRRPRLRVVA